MLNGCKHRCAVFLLIFVSGFLCVHCAAASDDPAVRPEPVAGKSKIGREAAIERLRGDYSLEGVARKHIEVEYDDLRGLSQPMTQRTTIQAKNHPDAVFVHPDLSIVLGAPADSYVVGFALGTPARLPAVEEATHELHEGYQPIVKSRWQTRGFTLEQIAFGVLPADEAVRSGTEKQDVMIRIAVTNDSNAPVTTALVLLTGKAGGTQMENQGYTAFHAPVSRWQQEKMKVADVQGSLMLDGRVLLTYRTSAPTAVALQPKLEVVQAKSKEPITVNNGLRFELQLKPRETRYLDFVIAGSSKLYPETERNRMAAEDFQKALQKAESRWDKALEPGMKLSTPEPRLNNIYKHLVLSCLENVPQEPNVPWVLPIHSSGYAGGVWPCEFVKVSVPLDSLGFHKDTEACLRWFTEHQSGVGKHGEDIGPDGEVNSTQGCFVGANSPRWMCETGVVLWMLGAHYRYSHDAAWLTANRDSMLAACDWIKKQRDTTRTTAADGERVAHFGLLPKGRVHDWAGHYYYYCFSDGYTCKGMAETAAAFRALGAPEADRLSADADEYRRCIRDTVKKVAFKDPDTGLLFLPNTVYFRQGDRGNGGVWLLDGPRVLFDLGILDPVADAKYWQPMLEFVQRRWGTLGGLMCHFNTMENGDEWTVPPASPFWYVLAGDACWHRDFLARGESEKALLVLYSSLVYAMSEDMFETVERVNTADSNFAPFQPNSSGNGLVLTMLRRIVIDEQDEAKGTLWLLRGCPRRWFAPGKSIDIGDAPTVFGKTALRTTCSDHAIAIDIDPPANPAMKQLCIAVRHPARQKPKNVTINGASTTIDGEIVTVHAPSGHLRIVAEYD